MSRILLLFIDGVGIGAHDAARNAFVAAPPPTLTSLVGVIAEPANGRIRETASLMPLDAQLGVGGRPQSGTGQYSLFTGSNGALEFGRHYGPWVPTALRDPLRFTSLLARARALGARVAFANAYPEELLASAVANGSFKPVGPLRAGPPLAAAGADVLTRTTRDLMAGRALTSEITNEAWRERLQRRDLPRIDGAHAGEILARIANDHDLTLYAHYTTDYAGHQQDLGQAVSALQLVDELLRGVLAAKNEDVTVILVSDHGNLEDVTTGHTLNPALGLVTGPAHARIAAELKSLVDVAPAVLRELDPASSTRFGP
jgi:hypothetical protein